MAKAVRLSNLPPDFSRVALSKTTRSGIYCQVKLKGVSADNFNQRYGKDHKFTDLSLQNILLPGMGRYKGIIVWDDGKWPNHPDNIDLSHFGEVAFRQESFTQELKDCRRETQSSEVWNCMLAHDDEEDKDVTPVV